MSKTKSNGKTHYYPWEKMNKYFRDLKAKKETEGTKDTPKGKALTKSQKAYRAGYINATQEMLTHHNLKEYGKPYNPKKFDPTKKRSSVPVTSEYGEPND